MLFTYISVYLLQYFHTLLFYSIISQKIVIWLDTNFLMQCGTMSSTIPNVLKNSTELIWVSSGHACPKSKGLLLLSHPVLTPHIGQRKNRIRSLDCSGYMVFQKKKTRGNIRTKKKTDHSLNNENVPLSAEATVQTMCLSQKTPSWSSCLLFNILEFTWKQLLCATDDWSHINDW